MLVGLVRIVPSLSPEAALILADEEWRRHRVPDRDRAGFRAAPIVGLGQGGRRLRKMKASGEMTKLVGPIGVHRGDPAIGPQGKVADEIAISIWLEHFMIKAAFEQFLITAKHC
jgi:hypothetical protein